MLLKNRNYWILERATIRLFISGQIDKSAIWGLVSAYMTFFEKPILAFIWITSIYCTPKKGLKLIYQIFYGNSKHSKLKNKSKAGSKTCFLFCLYKSWFISKKNLIYININLENIIINKISKI